MLYNALNGIYLFSLVRVFHTFFIHITIPETLILMDSGLFNILRSSSLYFSKRKIVPSNRVCLEPILTIHSPLLKAADVQFFWIQEEHLLCLRILIVFIYLYSFCKCFKEVLPNLMGIPQLLRMKLETKQEVIQRDFRFKLCGL